MGNVWSSASAESGGGGGSGSSAVVVGSSDAKAGVVPLSVRVDLTLLEGEWFQIAVLRPSSSSQQRRAARFNNVRITYRLDAQAHLFVVTQAYSDKGQYRECRAVGESRNEYNTLLSMPSLGGTCELCGTRSSECVALLAVDFTHYRWLMMGTGADELMILSREPSLEEHIVHSLLQEAHDIHRFDTSSQRVEYTAHTPGKRLPEAFPPSPPPPQQQQQQHRTHTGGGGIAAAAASPRRVRLVAAV